MNNRIVLSTVSALLSLLLVMSASRNAAAMPDSRSIFTHLSLEEGLSQVSVLSITQDPEGYIWIATFDGLDRFDGYDIKVYRNESNDPKSLLSNVIRNLFIDSKGTLWVGTTEGLCRYDRDSDSFERIIARNSRSYSFCDVQGKGLFVRMGGESYILDYENGSPVDACPALMAVRPANAVEADGVLYVSARDSICRYDVGADSLSLVITLPGPPTNMIVGENGVLWLSSEGRGLFKVDPVTGEFENFRSREGGLCSNFIRPLCFDDDGFLWLGTGNNLSIMNVRTGTFTTVSPDPDNPHSLSHASIRAVFKDSEGGMWIGTYFGGVNYYHRNRDVFRTFQLPVRESDIIGCIVHDGKDRIWIGTTRGDVSCLSEPERDGFDVRLPHLGSSLDAERNDTKSLLFLNDRKLLIGTEFGGLYEFDQMSERVVSLAGRGGPLSAHSILPDGDFLLIGSMSGLYYMRSDLSAAGKIENEVVSGSNGIYKVFRDSSGELWLGSGNGAIKCSLHPGPDGYPGISIDDSFAIGRIEDVYESADGIVWLAGSRGLYSYNAEYDSTPQKVENVSFASDFIHGIEQDAMGRFWLSTEGGLSSYTPSSGQVRNYYKEDGLPSNVFTIHSHTRSSDGTMYFGGLLGITSFRPDDMPLDAHSAMPSLSDLFVYGKKIVPGDDTGILKKELRLTERIDLAHGQNDFSIKFSAKNYSSWKGSNFKFCLSDVDKDWVAAGPERLAHYSDIPKGKHVFKVMSSNADGLWCESPAVLLVVMHPAWYNTLVFRIIVLMLILLLLMFGIYMLIRYIYRENEKRMESLRASKDDMIRELKMLSFFGLAGSSMAAEDRAFLSEAYRLIEENYGCSSFSVDAFADGMKMSRSTLYAKLKGLTGMSPTDFIKKMRLEQAREMLSNSSLSVSEIAYKVGFSSPAYFATDFRKNSGLTPKEYRSERN